MNKRPTWQTPLPRPITIPKVTKLKTLADVRKLLKHIPAERRAFPTWRHVEASLRESPEDAAVALKLVLMIEGVPYSTNKKAPAL